MYGSKKLDGSRSKNANIYDELEQKTLVKAEEVADEEQANAETIYEGSEEVEITRDEIGVLGLYHPEISVSDEPHAKFNIKGAIWSLVKGWLGL